MSAGFVNEVVNIQQDQSYFTSSTTQQQTLFYVRTLIINKFTNSRILFYKNAFLESTQENVSKDLPVQQ